MFLQFAFEAESEVFRLFVTEHLLFAVLTFYIICHFLALDDSLVVSVILRTFVLSDYRFQT